MTFKNITHICNNYVGTKVHSKLCINIASHYKNISQNVFIPIRDKNHKLVNALKDNRVNEDYILCNFKFLKFLPLLKVLINFFVFRSKQYKSDLIISHTVWSDGVIAYLNYLIAKTPYSVSVRDTDFNVFFPKLRHYHWLIRLVLKNANSVVFINKCYLVRSSEKFPKLFSNLNNLVTIPNGVDNFWLENQYSISNKERDYDFIFVGNNEPRKNLKRVFSALSQLSTIKKIKFCIVGLDVVTVEKILSITDIPTWIDVLGKLNKEQLIAYYRNSKILLVPSYRETFGLVYIEALSQGCAVIHAKNEGIDKMFDTRTVRAVDPMSIDEILNTSNQLLSDYSEFKADINIDAYDWSVISDRYLNIFETTK